MIVRYNELGEPTHLEHPEDQQFTKFDRSQFQQDSFDYELDE